MLSKEKIRIMAQLAAYEEHDGRKDFSINGYFRGDYITFELLKSAIYATVGFILAVAMYVLYNLENFMEGFYKMNFVEFLQEVLSKYWVVLAVYLVISYFVYAYRYHRSRKHVKKYKQQLRALSHMYNGRSRR